MMKVKTLLLGVALFTLGSCKGRAELLVSTSSPNDATTNTLSEHIGLETLGGVLTPVLRRGCKFPCEVTQTFGTAMDGQDQITITLFQGNSDMTSRAKRLGRFMVSGIDPGPRGLSQVAITLRATTDEVTMSARIQNGSGKLGVSRID